MAHSTSVQPRTPTATQGRVIEGRGDPSVSGLVQVPFVLCMGSAL